jgi:thiamine biosynthesis protein ThiS
MSVNSMTSGTATVTIRVNGKNREARDGHTILSLLEELELRPGMVVVELNREILPRDRYAEFAVKHGDSIELVHFVGGG